MDMYFDLLCKISMFRDFLVDVLQIILGWRDFLGRDFFSQNFR